MLIGVFGDTHNNLPSIERIVEIFERRRVDRVVHTGDITQPKVLDALSALTMPLHCVYGNNDQGERPGLERSARRHGIQLVDGPLEVTWARQPILIAHDPLDLEPLLAPHHVLGLHGHTHLYRHEEINGTLVFCPGECAGMLQGQNRVGLVDLIDLHCEIEYF
ncbi:MAG TPA: YfcE family phosphodiesterase [Myxococcales bacterium]|nr:YfcE family phosphodiesterase [Myxococcales bacterium]